MPGILPGIFRSAPCACGLYNLLYVVLVYSLSLPYSTPLCGISTTIHVYISTVHVHLDSFQFLDILNSATINILVYIF